MSGILHDVEQQDKSLQQQNFDLKMAVFHLEEKLEKLAANRSGQYYNGGVGNGVDGGDNDDEKAIVEQLRAEHIQQRVLLEQKTLELEERDAVLVKARGAIEQLQRDLQASRKETSSLRESLASRPDQAELERTSSELGVVERERDELAREKSRLQNALAGAQQSARTAKVDAEDEVRRVGREETDRRLEEQADNFKARLKMLTEDNEAARKEIAMCRTKLEKSGAEVVSLTEELLSEREATKAAKETYHKAIDEKEDIERRIQTVTRAAGAVAAELESVRRENRERENAVRKAQLAAAEGAGRMAEEAQWMEALRVEVTELRDRQAADATQAAQLCVALDDARTAAATSVRNAQKAVENHEAELHAMELKVKEAQQAADVSKALEVQLEARVHELERNVREHNLTIEKLKEQSQRDLDAALQEAEKVRNEKTALQKAIEGLTTGQSLDDGATGYNISSVLSGPAAAAMSALTDARKTIVDAKTEMKGKEVQYKSEIDHLKGEVHSSSAEIESLKHEINDLNGTVQAEKVRADGIKHSADLNEREAKTVQKRLSDDLHEARQALDAKSAEYTDVSKSKEELERTLLRTSLELESSRKQLDDLTKVHASHVRDREAHEKSMKEEHTARVDEIQRHHESVKVEMTDQIQAIKTEMTERVADLKREHEARIRDVEGRSTRMEALKDEAEKARRDEVRKDDERRRSMEDAAVKLREELADAKTTAEADHHARVRAEKDTTEALERAKEHLGARERSQAEAERSRAECEALKRAAKAAGNTLQQLLTSLPLHVDDALNGLIHQPDPDGSLTAFRATMRREKRHGVVDGFGGGGWGGGDGDNEEEDIDAKHIVPIDRVATYASQALLAPLRRLITVRQHFQDAVAEAIQRREEQETVASKAMQELESRLAVTVQNVSLLQTAVKVNATKDIAAAKEDARSRIEAMRVQLVQIEAVGRDAAREAEIEAEKVEKLSAELEEATQAIDALRDDLEEAGKTQRETEAALRDSEATLREREAVFSEREAALQKEIEAASQREQTAREDFDKRGDTLKEQLDEQKGQLAEIERKLAKELEANNREVAKRDMSEHALRQELNRANTEKRELELKCQDLELRLQMSQKEVQMLTKGLETVTSTVTGGPAFGIGGGSYGLNIPSAGHAQPMESPVRSSSHLQMQQQQQQQQQQQMQQMQQNQSYFQAQSHQSAEQMGQLQAQLNQLRAHATDVAAQLQQAQADRRQLGAELQHAQVEGDHAKAQRMQLELQVQQLQEAQKQQLEQQFNNMSAMDGTSSISSPTGNLAQRRARYEGGHHSSVAELDKIVEDLNEASRQASELLRAALQAVNMKYDGTQASPATPTGGSRSSSTLSAAAKSLSNVDNSPAVLTAAAAVARVASAAESLEKRKESFVASVDISKNVAEDLAELIQEVQRLVRLAAHHVAATAADFKNKGSALEQSSKLSKSKSPDGGAVSSPNRSWRSIVNSQNSKARSTENTSPTYVTRISPNANITNVPPASYMGNPRMHSSYSRNRLTRSRPPPAPAPAPAPAPVGYTPMGFTPDMASSISASPMMGMNAEWNTPVSQFNLPPQTPTAAVPGVSNFGGAALAPYSGAPYTGASYGGSAPASAVTGRSAAALQPAEDQHQQAIKLNRIGSSLMNIATRIDHLDESKK